MDFGFSVWIISSVKGQLILGMTFLLALVLKAPSVNTFTTLNDNWKQECNKFEPNCLN